MACTNAESGRTQLIMKAHHFSHSINRRAGFLAGIGWRDGGDLDSFGGCHSVDDQYHSESTTYG